MKHRMDLPRPMSIALKGNIVISNLEQFTDEESTHQRSMFDPPQPSFYEANNTCGAPQR